MAPAAKRKKAPTDDATPAEGTAKRAKTTKATVTKDKAAPRAKAVSKPKAAPRGQAIGKKRTVGAKGTENEELNEQNGQIEEHAVADLDQQSWQALEHTPEPSIATVVAPEEPANTKPVAPVENTTSEDTEVVEVTGATGNQPDGPPVCEAQPNIAPSLTPMTASGKRKLAFADDPDIDDEPTSQRPRRATKPSTAVAAKRGDAQSISARTTSAEPNPIAATEDVLEDIEEGEPSGTRQRTTAAPAVAGAKEKKKSSLLWDRCVAEKPIGEHFSVQELTTFGIADDQEELKVLTQELIDHHLFTPLHLNRGFLYRARTKDVALK
jgi:hypothetical protein